MKCFFQVLMAKEPVKAHVISLDTWADSSRSEGLKAKVWVQGLSTHACPRCTVLWQSIVSRVDCSTFSMGT